MTFVHRVSSFYIKHPQFIHLLDSNKHWLSTYYETDSIISAEQRKTPASGLQPAAREESTLGNTGIKKKINTKKVLEVI